MPRPRKLFRVVGLVLPLHFANTVLAGPAELRAQDLSFIFHPSNVALELEKLSEPLSLIAQSLAVFVIIAALLVRMRRDEAQMDSIASMMLKVAFIATIPLWRGLALETGDLVADGVGYRSLPSGTLALTKDQNLKTHSPLLTKLIELEVQWSLESSPIQDGLEDGQRPKEGEEEAWLARGWNWSKATHLASDSASQQVWSAGAGAERAVLLHRCIWGMGTALQFSHIAYYLVETLRVLLFYGGFALMPVLIAGLGTQSFGAPAIRCLVGLAGVVLWPVGWALANVGTLAMLTPALEIFKKNAHAALYPKTSEELVCTLAQAAPHLSWSLLGMSLAMTLALCLWIIASLILVPCFAHKLLTAGARWIATH